MSKNPIRGDIVKMNLSLPAATADGLKDLSVRIRTTQAQLVREALTDLLAKYAMTGRLLAPGDRGPMELSQVDWSVYK